MRSRFKVGDRVQLSAEGRKFFVEPLEEQTGIVTRLHPHGLHPRRLVCRDLTPRVVVRRLMLEEALWPMSFWEPVKE